MNFSARKDREPGFSVYRSRVEWTLTVMYGVKQADVV